MKYRLLAREIASVARPTSLDQISALFNGKRYELLYLWTFHLMHGK